MSILKPPRLRRGDVIGLVAPASAPASTARVEAAVRYLEGRGYRVKVGRFVGARQGFFAGTDDQRASDLNGMLRDPQVKAIVALRGGYGTPRLLPRVDYRAARDQPKILVGYSDFTALQLALFRRCGLVTFSGPMAAVDFGGPIDPYSEEQFWRMLTSSRTAQPLSNPPGDPLVPRQAGCAVGRLLGGNLSLVVSSLGTPYSPNYRGALLVLEDVHEHLHRVDRMFTQLRNAGILSRVGGLVLGQFTQCRPSRRREPHLTLRQILDEVLTWTAVPTLANLRYGHVTPKLTIPWGVRARLDADRGRLELLESAVE